MNRIKNFFKLLSYGNNNPEIKISGGIRYGQKKTAEGKGEK